MISCLNLASLTLGKMTPLLLACAGGLLAELSGVINFALEGMMLAGAFGAVWASHASGSPWIGLIGGVFGGAIVGLIHASASLQFRANQIVSAISVNLLALGATGMLLNQLFEVYGTSPTVKNLPDLSQAITSIFPASELNLASSFGRLSIMTPIGLLLLPALFAFFRWSKWGLRIRACGENPGAAKALGLPVFRIRFLAVTASGALAGMGGAYLSIGELSQFVEHMTHGRGYLAIAALVLGRWKPTGIIFASLLFGFTEALAESLSVRWSQLPYQLFLALPYLFCLTALMLHANKRRPPSSLGA